MRIGHFAERFGVSIDTIRFYVENGLVLPEMVHNQRIFDQQCVQDMELVLTLKKMRFSLSEIKKMISLIRLTNLIDQSDKEYYSQFFLKKQEELRTEKEEIDQALQLIDVQLGWSSLDLGEESPKIGIPISFFSNFCCPDCGQALQLDQAKVESNQIHEGILSCRCGYKAKIEEGILRTRTAVEEETLVESRITHEYLDSFDPNFLSFAIKSVEWLAKRINYKSTQNSTILELGTGSGTFLGRIMEKLKPPCVYVATDQRFSQLLELKRVIEKHAPRPDLVLIASNFCDLPLRNASVDFVLDIYGTFSHMFTNDNFPISSVRAWMKHQALWYGAYVYFEPNQFEFLEPFKKQAPFFDLRRIKASFQGFEKVDAAKIGSCHSLGDLRNRMREGTISYAWACVARRILT